MNTSPALLLDTCAVIWLANGDPIAPEAAKRIVFAGQSGGILVSQVSAWEMGLLARPKSGRAANLQFRPDPKTWFTHFVAEPGIRLADFTFEIAIDVSALPGDIHNDPGDRMIIATARQLRVPIVTRDSKIIAYAASGHVEVAPF